MEGLLRLFGGAVVRVLARGVVKALDRHGHGRGIERLVVAVVAADELALAVVHEAMDGHGSLFAGGDGVDGKFLTRISVAADEDILFRRLIRDGVCLDRAVGVELNSGAGEQLTPVDLLADAVENRRALGLLAHTVVKLRCEAALVVLDARALAEFDARALAVLHHNLGLAPAGVDGDAVALALAAVFLAHRHIVVSL